MTSYNNILLIIIFSFSFGSARAQAPDISYQTPQVYTVNTGIYPLMVKNTGGAVPAVIYGNVSTCAGSGQLGNTNGIGTIASFRNPIFMTFDAKGNLDVADADNNVIRKITPIGVVSTFAGSGAVGKSDGSAGAATFNYPVGLATDAQGNIFVADERNNLIRKITPGGLVSTFAVSRAEGKSNGAGMAASFNSLLG